MRSIRTAILTLSVTCSMTAFAQTEASYPSRPLRFVVPFAPGGTTDTLARLVARELTKSLGQSVVVENRAGAGGLIGVETVLNLPPDGYTLSFATISTLALLPLARTRPGYEPLKEFTLITQLSTLPYVIAAHPSLPAHSIPDLVKLARAQPGVISYGSPGYGTGAHLTAEYLCNVTGIRLVHVPYKGDAPGSIDLIAGQIEMAVFPPVALLPHIKAGRVRALAVTSLERSSALPDTRTVAESGYSGFESGTWNGIAVRTGTPEAIVRRLQSEIVSILTGNADVRSNIEASGGKVVANTPDEFAAYVRHESDKWRGVISKAAIKID